MVTSRQRWIFGGAWRLVVEESDSGWSLREAGLEEESAQAPHRLVDSTGAFGAAAEEVLLKGSSGNWSLRIYPDHRVVAAGSPPGELSLPSVWWSEVSPDSSPLSLGFGAPGTSASTLEDCERRGWVRWLNPARRDGIGNVAGEIGFRVVSDWYAENVLFGDTPVLHRLAPRTTVDDVRDLCTADSKVGLDCRSLFRDSDGERDIADAMLFAHQAFGVRWLVLDARPSAVLERAMERAHMDAQGELFAAWVLEEGRPAARASWKRLGPCLRRSEGVSDCYVWVQ